MTLYFLNIKDQINLMVEDRAAQIKYLRQKYDAGEVDEDMFIYRMTDLTNSLIYWEQKQKEHSMTV